jgi:hypothetical protein
MSIHTLSACIHALRAILVCRYTRTILTLHTLSLDMLLVGNTPCGPQPKKPYGMSCGVLGHEEEQSQMALWAMVAAPLQVQY